MTAVLPRGNYSRNSYPTFGYKLINRNALKKVANNTIVINDIGESLYFVAPITIKYDIDEGYYTADYDVAGFVIASAETTKDAMIEDIKCQFRHAWDYYAMENDNRLNDSAKKVKEWLLHKVRIEK